MNFEAQYRFENKDGRQVLCFQGADMVLWPDCCGQMMEGLRAMTDTHARAFYCRGCGKDLEFDALPRVPAYVFTEAEEVEAPTIWSQPVEVMNEWAHFNLLLLSEGLPPHSIPEHVTWEEFRDATVSAGGDEAMARTFWIGMRQEAPPQ